MKNLYPKVERLVRQGVYSIYELDDGRIILYVPSRPACCSIHPGPAFIWQIDVDGNVLNNTTPSSGQRS